MAAKTSSIHARTQHSRNLCGWRHASRKCETGRLRGSAKVQWQYTSCIDILPSARSDSRQFNKHKWHRLRPEPDRITGCTRCAT